MSSKNVNVIVASWLIKFCHIGNFGFPVLILNFQIFTSQKLVGEFCSILQYLFQSNINKRD